MAVSGHAGRWSGRSLETEIPGPAERVGSVILVARDPLVGLTLSVTGYEVHEVRPDRLEAGLRGFGDVIAAVLALPAAAESAVSLNQIRSFNRELPVVVLTRDGPDWEDLTGFAGPEIRRLDLPLNGSELVATLQSLARPETAPAIAEPPVPIAEPSVPNAEPSVPNAEPSIPNAEPPVPKDEPEPTPEARLRQGRQRRGFSAPSQASFRARIARAGAAPDEPSESPAPAAVVAITVEEPAAGVVEELAPVVVEEPVAIAEVEVTEQAQGPPAVQARPAVHEAAGIDELEGFADSRICQEAAAKLTEIGAEAAAVILGSDAGWRVAAGVGLRVTERRFALDPDSWLIQQTVRGARVVLVEDTDFLRGQLANFPLASRRHLLAVGLPGIDGLLIGARDRRAFDHRERAGFADLARNTAQALLTSGHPRGRLACQPALSPGRLHRLTSRLIGEGAHAPEAR
jgi:hypothetical protein